ncbi:sigma factor-like helix-turn-helix DNA-binding protein [Methylomarinum sp. Ch1-1]|uniref:Sigma factor-like helix-turn-helix DNA-binding protein n=1 Tax=Methylomarinum roseum TaxID=3067653 RepID=A0AAU7NSD0_9GAMM|nr:sigma factor-like helix-turn-helix DNA-binding protein [Methylomarinum sp. Ch1-1]MDP4520472.1 sigma factor-like helix-turn-helix DNA-binding protein [Methylomarinum sp. Ch1-1]
MANGEEDFFDRQGGWRIDLASWANPDKSLEQEQFLQVLHDCIERLPPRMAQLFILREVDGMESEEICRLLSISIQNNFWIVMSRTRVRLRHCLDLNWFSHWRAIVMLTCKEASRLASKSMDAKLTWRERLGLWAHKIGLSLTLPKILTE